MDSSSARSARPPHRQPGRPSPAHLAQLAHLSPVERAALEEAKAGLEAHYGRRLRALLLYGSRARGTADAESDVDLLVVLEKARSLYLEITAINKVTVPVGLRHSLHISCHPVEWMRYREGPMDPFLERVKEEGVAL